VYFNDSQTSLLGMYRPIADSLWIVLVACSAWGRISGTYRFHFSYFLNCPLWFGAVYGPTLSCLSVGVSPVTCCTMFMSFLYFTYSLSAGYLSSRNARMASQFKRNENYRETVRNSRGKISRITEVLPKV